MQTIFQIAKYKYEHFVVGRSRYNSINMTLKNNTNLNSSVAIVAWRRHRIQIVPIQVREMFDLNIVIMQVVTMGVQYFTVKLNKNECE